MPSCHRIARGVGLIPVALTGLVLLMSGCAGKSQLVSRTAPELALERACLPGRQTRQVSGSVWLKAASQDATGQFPALVKVGVEEGLHLEVTNLLGGTEAQIRVKDQKYEIRTPDPKRKAESGTGSWGGIPLRWATDLFLGRIPCPAMPGVSQTQKVRWDGELLKVEVPQGLEGGREEFQYGFREYSGQLWPEFLRWERLEGIRSWVEFRFEDPEDRGLSPRRWEAKSEQGEVKARWRDRKALP